MDILEVRHNRKGSPGGHCGGEECLGSLGDVDANEKESSSPFTSNRMVLEHLILGVSLSSNHGLEKEEDRK